MKKAILRKLSIAAMAIFGAVTLTAQDQPAPSESGPESTGHGVARVSLIHGDVSTQRGDSGDTAAAALNAPVVTGDKISTGDNSRAELQLDYANILRLSDHSQANIASLTDKEIQIQISQGSASYTAFKTSEIRPEVDTANLSVRPSKGDVSFRIDAISPDETEVTVRNGEAEVSTSSGSTQVRKGEMIVVRGSGADAQFKVEDARNRSDWDKWNDDRDHLIRSAESVNHTSPYYTGSQDLDAYGHWSTVPEYGSVWVPSVSSDWVPYRDGRWVWEPYYGWTWVSNEPWGWAPYHYGRWFYSDASWVWWPGPVGGYGYGYGRGYYRPIWAPAYVSFFGFGGGFGVGVGFGSFGWLPIGPCDSFYPWYGGYRSRFNVVTINNFYGGRGDRFRGDRFGGERPLYHGRGVQYSNLRNVERDPHIRGAMSSVSAEHFGSGREAARGIDGATFRQARMMTGNLPVVPTRESLNASNRPALAGAFHGSQPGHFFGTNRPTGSTQSFDRQAAQVQQSIQHDGHFAPVHSGQTAGNNSAVNHSGDFRTNGNQAPNNTNSQRGGFSPREGTTNQPGRSADSRSGSTDQGWHRFSGPAAGAQGVNRGTSQIDSRGTAPRSIGQPAARGGEMNSGKGNGGWQRFPSSQNRGLENRGSDPGNRGSIGNSGPSSGGNRGWERGPSPNAPRESGPHGSSPSGDYGRGSGRPTLDMRQPVVTPRSSGPSMSRPSMSGPSISRPSMSGPSRSAPSAPSAPRGGGGHSEAPRSSGGGGHGGGGGGGRSSGGGHRG